MPRRKTIFAIGEYYHVFNRSIAREPIFLNKKDYFRFTNLVDFYRFKEPSIRFSHYNRLKETIRNEFIENLHKSGEKLVQIHAFCLIPNHFHFLLKQLEDNGISNFIRNLQNSYAKYLNTKYKRTGSLFQEMFKAVHIQTDEQLIHVIRYIHLNPVTEYILGDVHQLKTYPWTSFPNYMGILRRDFLDTDFVLKMFKSKEALKKFTYDQVDYQRRLARIKHLMLE